MAQQLTQHLEGHAGEQTNTRRLWEDGRSKGAPDASRGRPGFHFRPGWLPGWREGVAGILSRRCLFPWGMVRSHRTDDLRGADWNIPGWWMKVTFLGKVETAA